MQYNVPHTAHMYSRQYTCVSNSTEALNSVQKCSKKHRSARYSTPVYQTVQKRSIQYTRSICPPQPHAGAELPGAGTSSDCTLEPCVVTSHRFHEVSYLSNGSLTYSLGRPQHTCEVSRLGRTQSGAPTIYGSLTNSLAAHMQSRAIGPTSVAISHKSWAPGQRGLPAVATRGCPVTVCTQRPYVPRHQSLVTSHKSQAIGPRSQGLACGRNTRLRRS